MATLRVDANQILKALTNADIQYRVYVKLYCEEQAKLFQNYAKLHRPWRDRTGQARQRLIGYVETERNNDIVWVCIAHGVSYGKSLEYEHEKRYAILYPTVKALSGAALSGFKALKVIFNKT